MTFPYLQPFVDWTNTDGMKEFPCFNYNFSSILCQKDGYNCGFAAVANAFAFVKHLKDVKIDTS